MTGQSLECHVPIPVAIHDGKMLIDAREVSLINKDTKKLIIELK